MARTLTKQCKDRWDWEKTYQQSAYQNQVWRVLVLMLVHTRSPSPVTWGGFIIPKQTVEAIATSTSLFPLQSREGLWQHYHGEQIANINLPHQTSQKTMGFAGYVAVCVPLYCRCFTVLHLVVTVFHYMFRPTWPSSSVQDVFIFIFVKESALLVLLAQHLQ
jgi:hypothetical protein